MLSSWTLPETFPETFLVVQECVPRKVPKESIVSAFGNVPKVVIPKERTCQSSRLFSPLLCARKPHTLPLLHAHFWCSSKTAKKSARARTCNPSCYACVRQHFTMLCVFASHWKNCASEFQGAACMCSEEERRTFCM